MFHLGFFRDVSL